MLSLAVLALVLILWRQRKEVQRLRHENRSLSTRYGKAAEQLLPFAEGYPYDPGRFRFLGTPVDGVQFEDDRIIFLEFKSGKSMLSKNQKSIKELVDKGKVSFAELRLREGKSKK